MSTEVIAPGTTWSGSHTFGARGLVSPGTVAQLQEIVAREPRVRALGSRHSFTDLADTSGLLVSVDRFEGADGKPRLVGPDRGVVRVPAGMRYGELAVWLEERGRALANLASLPHISVAGAVATGTHGSGVGNGSLATAVRALELVDGRGELVRLEADGAGSADFAGAVVGLGALGVVTHLELQTEPSYDVVQVVHEGLVWSELEARVREILDIAYSVSVFTRWVDEPDGSAARVWVKSRSGSPAVPGARPADGPRHVIPGLDPTLTTEQLGRPGRWHERLPHFRLGFQPSRGQELQSEYLLPLDRAGDALAALRSLADRIASPLLVAEIRAVAADDLWLSGAYGVDTLALHFTWRLDPEAVRGVLPAMEERLLPLGARPHWGKLFAAGPTDLAPLYPRWGDFCALMSHYDPDGRFRNPWLDRYFS